MSTKTARRMKWNSPLLTVIQLLWRRSKFLRFVPSAAAKSLTPASSRLDEATIRQPIINHQSAITNARSRAVSSSRSAHRCGDGDRARLTGEPLGERLGGHVIVEGQGRAHILKL